MFEPYIAAIRALFGDPIDPIPLHAPWFDQEDEDAVSACVRSTFVSSIGAEISGFEADLAAYTGAAHAVATVNGTAALHTALLLADVRPGDLVITQSFSFIATANAITYTGARPLFIDIDAETLGLSPKALRGFLDNACEVKEGRCIHRASGKRIKACVPMHSFGTCVHMPELVAICKEHHLALIEDAAEALGSTIHDRHAGTWGLIGTLSFNGNKIITCGGGGALLFEDGDLAKKAKHLTTQAKLPHEWAFSHDPVGYNYRMPNLNAALARSQMSKLHGNINAKRDLHERYRTMFADSPWTLHEEPDGVRSNYWLNALLLSDRKERDAFLKESHKRGVLTRPAWEPGHTLPMYTDDIRGDLRTTMDVHDRLVNLPSSVIR
ncbi:MAG: LegC family aminotransferase [Flavobacteriales bacterium]